MRVFYFSAGRFQAEGMGYHYPSEFYFTVEAETSTIAKQKAEEIITEKFGKRLYCDMWYGLLEWNWNYEMRSPYFWHKEQGLEYKIK